MKRFLTILSLTALMIACEVGPRQSNALSNNINELPKNVTTKFKATWASVSELEKDNIIYLVISSGSSDGGIKVVNHTKELLEVKKLREELGN